jgi:hypothetical protein
MKRTYDRLQVLKLNIYYCNIIEHCDKDKYFNPKKYVYNFKPAHVVSPNILHQVQRQKDWKSK